MSDLPLLYLCRHGQTDWNAERRLQGQSDIPLNALGRAQARRNGRYLKIALGTAAADFLFMSSPMSRAVDTMRLLRRELGLEPDDFRRDPRLAEIHFGDWQGFTVKELEARDPEACARREADKWNFLPPGQGAETYEALSERVSPVFRALDRHAIVTAHGGITRAFLHRFAGYSKAEASHIDVPQDRILRCEAGRIAWV